jgi:hypothetical protein
MQSRLRPFAMAGAEVAQDPQHPALESPVWVGQIIGIEIGPVVEREGERAAQGVEPVGPQRLDHVRKRDNAHPERMKAFEILREGDVLVVGIVPARDVHRVVGEHRNGSGARHGAGRGLQKIVTRSKSVPRSRTS